MKAHKKEQQVCCRPRLFLLAVRAETAKRDFEVLDFLTARQGADFHRADQVAFNVFDPATLAADEMMMIPNVRVEADAAALKDFLHHTRFLEPVERVVNRRPRGHRELAV